jgi:hypothetical protein
MRTAPLPYFGGSVFLVILLTSLSRSLVSRIPGAVHQHIADVSLELIILSQPEIQPQKISWNNHFLKEKLGGYEIIPQPSNHQGNIHA